MDKDNLILEAIRLFRTRTETWLYDWILDAQAWVEKAEKLIKGDKL